MCRSCWVLATHSVASFRIGASGHTVSLHGVALPLVGDVYTVFKSLLQVAETTSFVIVVCLIERSKSLTIFRAAAFCVFSVVAGNSIQTESFAPLSSSHEPASKTPFTETPVIEVSAKEHPRYFALHPNFDEPPSQRVSPFRLECRTRCHCRLETTGPLAFRIYDPRSIPTQEVS